MPTLSIIVPIYNVEKYLSKCIDSILAQTFNDFELILVDDGSTDNSRLICKKYEKIDNRIKILFKKNGGVSSARNAGIEVAKGEYIAFVDPDDTLERNMYDVLLKSALKSNVDMVVCQIKTINERLKRTSISPIFGEGDSIINKQSIEKFLIPSIILDNTYSLVPVFNKIYKKSLFDSGVKFDESKHFAEDARLNFTLLTIINNLVYVKNPLYNYFVHKRESLGQIFREDLYEYALDNKKFLMHLCKKYNLENLIGDVKHHFTHVTLVYMEDLVSRNIQEKTKIKILSSILKDNDFNQDLKIYKGVTVQDTIKKQICKIKSEKLFISFIKTKNKFKQFSKREKSI